MDNEIGAEIIKMQIGEDNQDYGVRLFDGKRLSLLPAEIGIYYTKQEAEEVARKINNNCNECEYYRKKTQTELYNNAVEIGREYERQWVLKVIDEMIKENLTLLKGSGGNVLSGYLGRIEALEELLTLIRNKEGK